MKGELERWTAQLGPSDRDSARERTHAAYPDVRPRFAGVAVRDHHAPAGAATARRTGLAGLKDRLEALGGRIFLDSPAGAGTSLRVELPLT